MSFIYVFVKSKNFFY